MRALCRPADLFLEQKPLLAYVSCENFDGAWGRPW